MRGGYILHAKNNNAFFCLSERKSCLFFSLGWREFSKTSRPSICDLRFEEILNKIKPEKSMIERGAIGTSSSTSNYTTNGNTDGNGL